MQECVLSTDRRSVRTRRALRAALAREIDASGDLSRVTVTAVSERAGVTRRTFYSHFRDIPDLVTQIEDETLAELRAPLARIAQSHLDDLRAALDRGNPAPGAVELLDAVRDRADYLRPLLGTGGDPAFAERLKRLAHDVVAPRALDDLDARAFGSFFDYYLTFAISAEVGVLLRWLDAGCRESVPTMARLMTALMFVRPGDLYDNPIELDIPRFALSALCSEEDN
ncbi:TetR-like C-terminal domain-containing protein [Thermophilibacter sp.]